MRRDAFTLAYDGPALRDGAMDVRDLAPALMALGQLLDAANTNLNGSSSQIKLQVKATERGSFQIGLELIQSWSTQVLQFFSSPEVSGATNLLSWVLGVGGAAGGSVLWLIKFAKGRTATAVERIEPNVVRLTFGTETVDVPIELLRLFQDVSVRNAAQKLIEEPLKTEGINLFQVKDGEKVIESVSDIEAAYFAKPTLPDETLVDEIRRSAFSIVSLTFKEDNKWRLHDGNTQISATISDENFLHQVNVNQVSFSKGDILICDVRVTQKRTSEGLRTDYIVEQVVEHRPAARQLPLPLQATTKPPED